MADVLTQEQIDNLIAGNTNTTDNASGLRVLTCFYCGKKLGLTEDASERDKQPIKLVLAPGCKKRAHGHMYVAKDHQLRYPH